MKKQNKAKTNKQQQQKKRNIDPIHKWQLFYFCSVIVQISLPSLTLE